MEYNKTHILGQYFTKETVVNKLLKILFDYIPYKRTIDILEPSFGTGNFINGLTTAGYNNITGCEIDNTLTNTPQDFFEYPLNNKYDLIVGNPPFSKYNVLESYYNSNNYLKSNIAPTLYLPKSILKKNKDKIENAFIAKSLKHLKENNSTLAFILPVSFFIKNKNKTIKQLLQDKFTSIIIYQNTENWFNYNIPCCFAIFTNCHELKHKIMLFYENDSQHKELLCMDQIYEELIPETYYNKMHKIVDNGGDALVKYLTTSKIEYNKSYKTNNVSGKNILTKNKIPTGERIADYKLAIVRVGNSSVGKCGLVNVARDTLNDMFYVLDFCKLYQNDKLAKENICEEINKNQNYFKSISCRVGSKSIKKEDIFSLKISLT